MSKHEDNKEKTWAILEGPKVWTAEVETDLMTGDAILTFPEDLLERLGWVEGDVLLIDDTDIEFGRITLSKKV